MAQRGMKVIHITQSEDTARRITELLTKEGFYAKSVRVYRQTVSGENDYEIVVADSEAVEAQQLLIERNMLY